MPLENRCWGERCAQPEDPFGHRWTLSMRVWMSREELEQKRKGGLAMFAEGEHPGHETTRWAEVGPAEHPVEADAPHEKRLDGVKNRGGRRHSGPLV